MAWAARCDECVHYDPCPCCGEWGACTRWDEPYGFVFGGDDLSGDCDAFEMTDAAHRAMGET